MVFNSIQFFFFFVYWFGVTCFLTGVTILDQVKKLGSNVE